MKEKFRGILQNGENNFGGFDKSVFLQVQVEKTHCYEIENLKSRPY